MQNRSLDNGFTREVTMSDLTRKSPVEIHVQLRRMTHRQTGKMGWAILWLLGIPLPVLLGVYFLRGCH